MQSIDTRYPVLVPGNVLEEIPKKWEKLPTQSTFQHPQTDVYCRDETWAIVQNKDPFTPGEDEYILKDVFKSFSVSVPSEGYPESLEVVELPDRHTAMLKSGYEYLVEIITTDWLTKRKLKVEEAQYTDKQLSLKLKETWLHSALKESYCNQIQQTQVSHEEEKEPLEQLKNEIRATNTYIAELNTDTINKPEDYDRYSSSRAKAHN